MDAPALVIIKSGEISLEEVLLKFEISLEEVLLKFEVKMTPLDDKAPCMITPSRHPCLICVVTSCMGYKS